MKVNRNDPCYCGSGKKNKKCCGKDGESNTTSFQKQKSLIIKVLITVFFGIVIYGFVDWMQTGVEMELYKCENPNCDQWHQRAKTSN